MLYIVLLIRVNEIGSTFMSLESLHIDSLSHFIQMQLCRSYIVEKIT